MLLHGCGDTNDDPVRNPAWGYVTDFQQLDCSIEAPLSVAVGEGETRYVELAAGSTLERHTGASSQGPYWHVFGAARVSGVDVDASPGLAFSFATYAVHDENSETECTREAYPWDDETVDPTDCWDILADQNFTLGLESALDVDPDGVVDATGARLAMYDDGVAPARISVVVRDQCGRVASHWLDVDGAR